MNTTTHSKRFAPSAPLLTISCFEPRIGCDYSLIYPSAPPLSPNNTANFLERDYSTGECCLEKESVGYLCYQPYVDALEKFGLVRVSDMHWTALDLFTDPPAMAKNIETEVFRSSTGGWRQRFITLNAGAYELGGSITCRAEPRGKIENVMFGFSVNGGIPEFWNVLEFQEDLFCCSPPFCSLPPFRAVSYLPVGGTVELCVRTLNGNGNIRICMADLSTSFICTKA